MIRTALEHGELVRRGLLATVVAASTAYMWSTPLTAGEKMPLGGASEVVTLQNYEMPLYTVSDAWISFEIQSDAVEVTNRMTVLRSTKDQPLVLDGTDLKLVSVEINGKELSVDEYFVTPDQLVINHFPTYDTFTVTIKNRVIPGNRGPQQGLFWVGDALLSQCEPQGLRRITYFVDRPDVLCRFNVQINGDDAQYPTRLAAGREYPQLNAFLDYTWKPSYQFGFVAGNFEQVSDSYQTRDGRSIDLSVYTPVGRSSRATLALEALKKAMEWDEIEFDRTPSRSQLKLVAVDGLGETTIGNCELLVFDSSLLLVDPSQNTDAEIAAMEQAVAHQYFHHNSGNMLSIRSFGELALKEGLATYRQQKFTESNGSSVAARIATVKEVRRKQFAEEDTAVAHALQPDLLGDQQLYTATTFLKGAETFRMMELLAGSKPFFNGLKNFFNRDRRFPASVGELVADIEGASDLDLQQFSQWYSTQGTPEVKLTFRYDDPNDQAFLTVEQSGTPMHFPLVMGIVDRTGKAMDLDVEGFSVSDQLVLPITEAHHTFTFRNVKEWPVPSVFRDFSAPVKVKYSQPPIEHIRLVDWDPSLYNRWESIQKIYGVQLRRVMRQQMMNLRPSVLNFIYDAQGLLIAEDFEDNALMAACLELPSEADLADMMPKPDFDIIRFARQFTLTSFSGRFEKALADKLDALCREEDHSNSADGRGRRELKRILMEYLGSLGGNAQSVRLQKVYKDAHTMSDRVAALQALLDSGASDAEDALADFYMEWKDDASAISHWFAVQAKCQQGDALSHVQDLRQDPAYDSRNAKHVHALIGGFASNLAAFHDKSGSGYQVVADAIIEADRHDAVLAASLVDAFHRYPALDAVRQQAMRRELERILDQDALSTRTARAVRNLL